MKQLKFWKLKNGFSLTEMVMVVAIIGILSSIAVPNLMRLKLQTNMEIVKQHMRVIGEKLTELMAKQGKLPDANMWGQGDTEEELSLTANLSSIDQKGYTTENYNPDGYEFTSCPKDPSWGISGDRCFRLNPFGVFEMEPWEGFWRGTNAFNDELRAPLITAITGSDKINFFDKANAFSLIMQSIAITSSYALNSGGNFGIDCGAGRFSTFSTAQSTISSQIPSTYIVVPEEQRALYQALMDFTGKDLGGKDIQIQQKERTLDYVMENCHSICGGIKNSFITNPNSYVLEIAFDLKSPIETKSDYQEKITPVLDQLDIMMHNSTFSQIDYVPGTEGTTFENPGGSETPLSALMNFAKVVSEGFTSASLAKNTKTDTSLAMTAELDRSAPPSP